MILDVLNELNNNISGIATDIKWVIDKMDKALLVEDLDELKNDIEEAIDDLKEIHKTIE